MMGGDRNFNGNGTSHCKGSYNNKSNRNGNSSCNYYQNTSSMVGLTFMVIAIVVTTTWQLWKSSRNSKRNSKPEGKNNKRSKRLGELQESSGL